MGIKYQRKYSDIIEELIPALYEIENVYKFFQMDSTTWNNLNIEEQKACIKTASDDIFYALGKSRKLKVGKGVVKYDQKKQVIKVLDGNNCIHIVELNKKG